MVDKWTIDVNLKGATPVTGAGTKKDSVGVKGIETILSSSKSLFGSIGKLLSTSMKALGLGMIVGFVAKIVLSSKMLLNMLGRLLKLIGLLLSPITDVITAFLYPILLIIKPIAIAVRQIMKPFTRLAMEMFKKSVDSVQGLINTLNENKFFEGE